jgi:hypothetical protein
MDALEEDACTVVTAPVFTAECPNATRQSVRVDGEPMAGMGQYCAFVDRASSGRSAPIADLPAITSEQAGSDPQRSLHPA